MLNRDQMIAWLILEGWVLCIHSELKLWAAAKGKVSYRRFAVRLGDSWDRHARVVIGQRGWQPAEYDDIPEAVLVDLMSVVSGAP